MRFNENEEAVSPVIGVILMVAITVILAAVIAVFVFGMTDNVQTNHNVAVTAKNVNDSAVMLTYQGGPDAAILDKFDLAVFNSTGELNTSYSAVDWEPSAVGASKTLGDLGSAGGHITVTAYFTDGTNQQILNKQF